jgi:hypothetical protein
VTIVSGSAREWKSTTCQDGGKKNTVFPCKIPFGFFFHFCKITGPLERKNVLCVYAAGFGWRGQEKVKRK